jgi:hypothetical protein
MHVATQHHPSCCQVSKPSKTYQLHRYDEPGLLQEVEKRLGSSIPSLSDDLSLPPELQARLAGRMGAEKGPRMYQLLCVYAETLVAHMWTKLHYGCGVVWPFLCKSDVDVGLCMGTCVYSVVQPSCGCPRCPLQTPGDSTTLQTQA